MAHMDSSKVLVVVDVEFPNEMPSSSLRLRRFDESFTKEFRQSDEHECKHRLLLKKLQGCSFRSLGHEDDDNDSDVHVVDGSSSDSTTRSNTFWFRRSSSGCQGGSRRVINRHCSLQEGTRTKKMNNRYPTTTTTTNPPDTALDNRTISEPVMVGSKNPPVFSYGGGRRASAKAVPQHNPSQKSSADPRSRLMVVADNKKTPQPTGLGLESSKDADDNSIDPDMPSSPPMHYQYQPQSQQQRPAVLQCLFGRRGSKGDGGTANYVPPPPPPPPLTMEAFGPPPSPSPTDSNVTTSDDEDDDEDLCQLAFCPADESSLPPPPILDRWSPSPPTVKMFSSEPPKLPTRRAGRRHVEHEEELLNSAALAPPRLPTRRPKMAENEMLAIVNSSSTTDIHPPPPPPLPCPVVPRLVGGCCPLSKPIPRTAAIPPLRRGTCSKLLCDNGGIVAAQQVTAATAPSTTEHVTVTMNAARDNEAHDTVVLPLIRGILTDSEPTPHQHEYGYHHHHGIQNKNNEIAVSDKRSGILKENGIICGHGTSIREGTWSRRGDEPKKQQKRSVTFGRIHIREYERILGDNPSCSCGPPISLGWHYWDLYDSTLDAYDCQKSSPQVSSSPPQRGKRDFYLSPSRRCELILHEWRQSCPPPEEEVRRAQREAALVQYCRETSILAASRSNKSSPQQSVVAFLCKPSVDDSDTSQPTSLHGRGGGGGGSPITTTSK